MHLIRNSRAFTGWKDRKTIVPWIRAIYFTETEELAHFRLDAFEAEWGRRYRRSAKPGGGTGIMLSRSSISRPPIRKMIYTTNAVERSLRKIIKTRGSFPTDEPTIKLLLPGHPERRRPMAKSY